MFWKKFLSQKQAAPLPQYGIPAGHLAYAIGDIHGRADLLTKLCARIAEDMATRTFEHASIVFLGDYVDRGFHSKEVIEALTGFRVPGVETIFLAGNHEDMMLDFLEDPANGQLWLKVGGLATLASYGVMLEDDGDYESLLDASNELRATIPPTHLTFLRQLQTDWQLGDTLFVHAGLRPGVPMEAQRRRDKLGIRAEFTESEFDFGVRVVHGHTGVRKPLADRRRVAVDTGAFATGVLTAAVFEGEDVSFLST